jgi:hypothetical protein
MNRETFTLVVGYGTFSLWFALNLLSVIFKDLEVNHYVNVAFMAVVGASFGGSVIQRGGQRDGSGGRRE